MFIKFCGMTRAEDVEEAVKVGVSAVGFIFAPNSPRVITPEHARLLARLTPPTLWRVGVFQNQSRDDVERIARLSGVDTLQFHGQETVEYCQGWREWRVVKALSCSEPELSRQLALWKNAVEEVLIDSPRAGGAGGVTVPDEIIERIMSPQSGLPCILAGGLTPENVAERITRFRPAGLDVSSGIESSPGLKDPEKMRRFVERVTNAAR